MRSLGSAAGDLAERHLQSEVPPEDVGARAEQRHLHDPPPARRALLQHGGEEPAQGGQPGDVVTDAAPRVERRALVVGHLHGEPGPGPERSDVVGGAVPLGAAQPVAADAAVHEMRMALDGRRGLQPEPVEGVGAEVADEDVGRGEQVLEVLPSLGSAQVEHDAAFAPVVEREGRVRHVAVDAQRPEHLAHGVARRGLDLDDVGSPVGQQRSGRRCGDPDAQLDDPQVCEAGEPR